MTDPALDLELAMARDGVTVAELAEALSVARSTVYRWMARELQPTATQLVRIGSALRLGDHEIAALGRWFAGADR